jgi:hypothetical protein
MEAPALAAVADAAAVRIGMGGGSYDGDSE